MSEIKIAEKKTEGASDNTELLKTLVKLQTLQLKLLHSLRANTVAVMRHQKVPLLDNKQERETV